MEIISLDNLGYFCLPFPPACVFIEIVSFDSDEVVATCQKLGCDDGGGGCRPDCGDSFECRRSHILPSNWLTHFRCQFCDWTSFVIASFAGFGIFISCTLHIISLCSTSLAQVTHPSVGGQMVGCV